MSCATASSAASAGVWNSGPMTTSKPRSAKAEAITLAPRSWPSWPILTTSTRGLRPSRSLDIADLGLQFRVGGIALVMPAIDAGDDLTCAPRGGPMRVSSAMEISPTVARARAASTAGARRLPLPVRATCSSAARRCIAGLRHRGSRGCGQCARSGSRAPLHCRSSGYRHGSAVLGWYLLTPTMTSSPRSTRACRARRPPRCAAWACRWRPPWSCRPGPRLPRSASRPRRPAAASGSRHNRSRPADRRHW